MSAASGGARAGARARTKAVWQVRRGRGLWLLAVLLLLLCACLMSVALGNRGVTAAEIAAGLRGRHDTIGEAVVAMRVPRTLLGLLAGGALGLAGAVLQGVTRNPLADPGILGINAGAAMAVVVGMAWLGIETLGAYIWSAILGAGLAACFVYAIASLGRGGATPLKLALAGAATSIALASFTVAVILPRNDIAGGFTMWRIGGIGGASFEAIGPGLPFLAAGAALCLASTRSLNLLALGDEAAAGLGAQVARARGAAALGAVLLCGAVTAICGPISFVGLVVPHLCRLLVGVDHRWLLPFSALTGGILLLSADVIGRIAARPSEMEVGIVTAFVGAPVFIWIVRQRRIRDL